MVRLELKRLKDGTPSRFHLLCPDADRPVAQAVGQGTARWSGAVRRWTYPVDPVIVRNILRQFPHAELTKDVRNYLETLRERQREAMQALSDSSPFGDDNLWDFQRGSVRFLLTARRAILAHDMGTGKTVVACKAVELSDASRVLIVCPNSVKWSWVDHIQEWAKRDDLYVVGTERKMVNDSAEIISGTKTEREDALTLLLRKRELVCVANYEQVRIHTQIFAGQDWDVLIVDEAHRIKNHQAQRTQAVQAVAKKSAYVWLLTGTPMRNCYSDFFGLLSAVDPLRFSSYWNFLHLHLDSVPGLWGGVDILGPRDSDLFVSMLSTYMYRKTKKEVMPDLPPKIYTEHKLDLNPKQERAYQQMEKEFILYIKKKLEDGSEIEDILFAPEAVAQIIRLRQICLTPAILGGVPDSGKLDALKELLEDLAVNGERVIIYSCFRKFLPYVAAILRKLTIPYGEIVGGQKALERREVEKKLNSGEVKAVLGTIQAMGEGMNLQAATTAIFCDQDWTPAVNLQAEDRIHRGEITRSPTIVRLYHPNTVEADIRSTCLRKTRAVDSTVGQVEAMRELLRRTGVL